MDRDPYRLTAPLVGVLEPLNAPLRDISLAMAAPAPGTRVLDVGCGAGTQLERYRRAGCAVTGIDVSEAMLRRARARLGGAADLRLGDASHLPFPDHSFDLVTATLVLHEMRDEVRTQVVAEMRRVLDEGGRALVVDFGPGPVHGLKGQMMRAVSTAAEIAARHYSRSRAFRAAGGVPVAVSPAFETSRTRLVAGGNMGLYLLTPKVDH